MKRVDNLWEPMLSDGNLGGAVCDVNDGHHWHSHHTPNRCTAWVEETSGERVEDLREIIKRGFSQHPTKTTRRYDANAQKWRTVNEPVQWPDQYVHHALIRVLKPVMMRGMDKYCCGSIKGRGAHYAKQAIERWMRKDKKGTKYCLTLDIRHFYESLKPEVVMGRMRQLVKDAQILDLIWRIVKDGVLIGAYTSQWFANTVLQPLDHLIREGGYGVAHYVRYMDNFTIFGANKRKLRRLKDAIEKWLNDHGLELKGDWQLFQTKYRLPDAVGYRYGRDYTIPRKHNFLRIKRQVARYRKRRDSGKPIGVRMAQSLLSRFGQLKHCNNRNIYRMLLRGEKLQRQLKDVIRAFVRGKELITWNTYLAQRAQSKPSEQRATPIPT